VELAAARNGAFHAQETIMDTNTLIVILLVVLLLGGGGFFYRRRV